MSSSSDTRPHSAFDAFVTRYTSLTKEIKIRTSPLGKFDNSLPHWHETNITYWTKCLYRAGILSEGSCVPKEQDRLLGWSQAWCGIGEYNPTSKPKLPITIPRRLWPTPLCDGDPSTPDLTVVSVSLAFDNLLALADARRFAEAMEKESTALNDRQGFDEIMKSTWSLISKMIDITKTGIISSSALLVSLNPIGPLTANTFLHPSPVLPKSPQLPVNLPISLPAAPLAELPKSTSLETEFALIGDFDHAMQDVEATSTRTPAPSDSLSLLTFDTTGDQMMHGFTPMLNPPVTPPKDRIHTLETLDTPTRLPSLLARIGRTGDSTTEQGSTRPTVNELIYNHLTRDTQAATSHCSPPPAPRREKWREAGLKQTVQREDDSFESIDALARIAGPSAARHPSHKPKIPTQRSKGTTTDIDDVFKSNATTAPLPLPGDYLVPKVLSCARCTRSKVDCILPPVIPGKKTMLACNECRRKKITCELATKTREFWEGIRPDEIQAEVERRRIANSEGVSRRKRRKDKKNRLSEGRGESGTPSISGTERTDHESYGSESDAAAGKRKKKVEKRKKKAEKRAPSGRETSTVPSASGTNKSSHETEEDEHSDDSFDRELKDRYADEDE